MAKYRVYLETTASATIHVEVPDDLDPDEAREAAFEKAFDKAPRSICAQCSGWGEKWSREEGEWEIATEQDGSEIAPELES